MAAPAVGWIYFDDNEDNEHRLDFVGDGAAQLQNLETDIAASGRHDDDRERDVVRHARMLGDGRYVKVYLDDERILNVPNADLPRTDKILFFTDAYAENSSLFGNMLTEHPELRLLIEGHTHNVGADAATWRCRTGWWRP